ncbi:MAG: UDP-N-acetylglucosamine 2-epimerase [Phycisphaerales bacterium]
MIGDGWDDTPSVRPGGRESEAAAPGAKLRVCVVTGTRAEFGLLKPVMRAIHGHANLELAVIAAGSHLVSPALTLHEVKKHFNIAEVVPMQIAGKTGRAEDVESTARGVARFGRAFVNLRPDWVIVLGDRIEAFAAGIAASIGGFALAHIHGGDRAEGIADESMRHALTKLAAIHFPASPMSAERIVRMGEDATRVHLVGSPAMDELGAIEVLPEEEYTALGSPTAVFLMHPVGQPLEVEEAQASAVLDGLRDERVVALMPNFDPGRDGVVRAIGAATSSRTNVVVAEHLPREKFVGLLKRIRTAKGVLVGNSSAGLIEAAALRVPVVDIGSRQSGRERVGNVVHTPFAQSDAVRQAVAKARGLDLSNLAHPYGDGSSGKKIAKVLASVSPRDGQLLRKRCAF